MFNVDPRSFGSKIFICSQFGFVGAKVMMAASAMESNETNGKDEQDDGKGEGDTDSSEGGLSDAQREVLERCLHSLKHAKNDSHTLAALLLVSGDDERDSRNLKLISKAAMQIISAKQYTVGSSL